MKKLLLLTFILASIFACKQDVDRELTNARVGLEKASKGIVELPKHMVRDALDIEDGKDGRNGLDGENGDDGDSPKLQIVGELGTYVEQTQDDRNFNLTCMLGESQESGKVVLRIISGDGGLVDVKRGGKTDTVYLGANIAYFLYAEKSGTYIVSNDTTSKTKACSP